MKRILFIVLALLCNSFINSAEIKEMAESSFPRTIKVNAASDISSCDILGLKESDPITLESFADMINEKYKQNMPFVIARVLSLDKDGNKIYKYYPVNSINEYIYGPKFTGGFEFTRRENGHIIATGKLLENQNLSRFRIVPGSDRIGTHNITDPITKGIISGEIRYYATYGEASDKTIFEYIGSDKDLTDLASNSYKRTRLARFLSIYNEENLTDQDKADLIFLLGRIYEGINNYSKAIECYNLTINFMTNNKLAKILDCVGHNIEKDCYEANIANINRVINGATKLGSSQPRMPETRACEKTGKALQKLPQEIRAVSNSMTKDQMGFDYFDVNTKITSSSKTFAQEIDEKYKQGLPFIIARVITMLPDETISYSYYPVSLIHKSIYGNPCFTGSKLFERSKNDHILPKPGATKEDLLSRYSIISGSNNKIGAKSVYDPRTGGYIALPISYYAGFGKYNTRNLTLYYLGSDKDLTDAQATDFDSYPKRLLLSRFLYLYCQADQKSILKEDIADLLFLLGQIVQNNLKNTKEATIYYNLAINYMMKNEIKNIINTNFTQRNGNVIENYSLLDVDQALKMKMDLQKTKNDFEKKAIKQLLETYQIGTFPNIMGNPNQSINRTTALIEAAKEGNFDIIEALIKIGADLTKENSEGQTPIMLYKKDTRLINLLTLNEMDLPEEKIKQIVNAKDDNGKTVLQYIKENFPEDKQIVEDLMNLGAKERESEPQESWGASEEPAGDWGNENEAW